MSTSRHKIPSQLLAKIESEDLMGRPGTCRRNHDDCPAGADTKRRLYVTRQDNGVILGYCHNCGAAGRADAIGPRVRGPFDYSRSLKPDHTLPELQPLTPRHAHFLQAYGIHLPKRVASLKDGDGIVFCNDDPLKPGMTYGIIRSFDSWSPKWVKIGGIHSIMHHYGTEELVRVYVEDAISSMKIGEIAGMTGVAVLGTHAHANVWGDPSRELSHIIWYDNDNPTVIEHAHELAQALANRGYSVCVVLGPSDPKKYPKAYLFEVIHAAHKLCRTTPPNDKPYHVYEVQPPHT